MFAGFPSAYVFSMKPSVRTQLRAEAVVQTRVTIECIDGLGVAEPSTAPQGGAGDEIRVECLAARG